MALPLSVALVLATCAASTRAAAQRVSPPHQTPSDWLQLRGGTDNAGRVPGTLDVSWSYKAEHSVRGLSVADDVVLIGTEAANAETSEEGPDERGFVTALDVVTGKPLWTRALISWVHGDPVVHDGVAFVTFGRMPMTFPGGAMALDVRTGRTLWSFDSPNGVMPAAALDTARHTLIVAGADHGLFLLSPATGAVEHVHNLPSTDAMSSPRVGGDAAYLGSGSYLVKLLTTTGESVWTSDLHLSRVEDVPVALSDSTVFTGGLARVGFWRSFRAMPARRFFILCRQALHDRSVHSREGWFAEQWLVALDRRTGYVTWRRSLGIGLFPPRNSSGTPVLSAGKVIFSSPIAGVMAAFDARSGRPLWRRQLSATHKGAVTVVDSMVVYGDRAGRLTILRLSDGSLLGQCTAGAPFSVTGPVVVGRTIFTTTGGGWVRASPFEAVRARAVRMTDAPCFA